MGGGGRDGVGEGSMEAWGGLYQYHKLKTGFPRLPELGKYPGFC